MPLIFWGCFAPRCAICRADLEAGQRVCGTTFFADTIDDILMTATPFQRRYAIGCCPECNQNTEKKKLGWVFHYQCLNSIRQNFKINSAGLRKIVKELEHCLSEVMRSPEEVLRKWEELEGKEDSTLKKTLEKLPRELQLMIVEEIEGGLMCDGAFLNSVEDELRRPSSEIISVAIMRLLRRWFSRSTPRCKRNPDLRYPNKSNQITVESKE
jgi:hypothetical protein